MKKVLNDSLFGKVMKTFIEGFVAALIVFLYNDGGMDKSILIGALAAGLSAVLNLIQKYLNVESGEKNG